MGRLKKKNARFISNSKFGSPTGANANDTEEQGGLPAVEIPLGTPLTIPPPPHDDLEDNNAMLISEHENCDIFESSPASAICAQK